MARRQRNRTRRLIPCPVYDVEGLEGWLGEMAQQGWLLEKDGIFCNTAAFERTEPRPVRYRLAAAMKSTSLWSEGGGAPDPEEVALGEMYGWEYVGVRGEFFIYRAFDPGARELNTDPAVQAAAVKAVVRRRSGAVGSAAFWLVVYPILFFFSGGIFLTAIQANSWYMLLSGLVLLYLFGDPVWEVIRLSKLKKRLESGQPLRPARPSRNQAGYYWGRKAAAVLLLAVWLGISLARWSASVLDEDKIPLSQAPPPPFATMADFAGEGAHNYELTFGEDLQFNYAKTWSDWLAPENYAWAEHAGVIRADGTRLTGGLYVDYHVTVSPWVARNLARDYVRHERGGKHYTVLDPPELEGGCAWAYIALSPTVVLQRGNVVLHASFYQTGEEDAIPLEEWAALLAESVG